MVRFLQLVFCVAAALLGMLGSVSSLGEPVEEFAVFDPMALHQLSLDYFLTRRRENPGETMDSDSPLMQRAREQAVRRLATQAEDELKLRSPMLVGDSHMDGSAQIEGEASQTGLLKLPSPLDPKEGILTEMINAQTSKELIVESGAALAKALAFNEHVGEGALAGAGAIPSGSRGEWIKLAEDKLKRDASLTHHALLWELGTEFAEQNQVQLGGLNVTEEEALLRGMHSWFDGQGGKLNFVKPRVTRQGFSVHALETIDEGEAIIKMPFRLIMCRQTARNVLIGRSGRYLGEELAKTFDRNEVWGLAIFLLHEYYKEINGDGSKWGPFVRTLRMRFLSTKAVQAIKGTVASSLSNEWIKSSDEFNWWTISVDGPCVPSQKICTTKPLDRHGSDNRFNIHQIRWAYWVVKQNAVRIRQVSTGLDFLALVPFFGMLDKSVSTFSSNESVAAGAAPPTRLSGVRFEMDGTVSIRAAQVHQAAERVKVDPGQFTDSEFFLRYLALPAMQNNNNFIALKLPGTIPKGSKFHFCIKGTQSQRSSDACTGAYRSESMFWKSKVLTEWRKTMNLPPRVQELRMWASRLHLYGTGEEAKLQSIANHIIAGLPIPVDDMPAEEQLMLMGVASSTNEAAVMLSGSERPATPQLYSAPDATDDPEAQRAMEELAYLAAQAQNAIGTGNILLNATQAVLNRTRDFFQHGVLPMAGLDELDDFLLKKIGMLAHCGFENDMKMTPGNVSKELMCAMRVHLMNESEIEVFCPAHARAWQDNCHDVEFLNFTAISAQNEALVVDAFRSSIAGLLSLYPTSMQEDEAVLSNPGSVGYDELQSSYGPVLLGAIQLRYNEKKLLHSVLDYLNVHEDACRNGTVLFQLEDKLRERVEADERVAENTRFQEQIRAAAAQEPPLAILPVDFGGSDGRKENLTLQQGEDVSRVVREFCELHKLPASNFEILSKALRERVPVASPLLVTLGVVLPSGERRVLAIPQQKNLTLEVGIFCARHDIASQSRCRDLESRAKARLETNFPRTVLLIVPIDAPDSRKLSFIIRQGEQHDLVQLAADFLELYHMPVSNAEAIAQEAAKRLPEVALRVPVSLPGRRQVNVRFSANDNITTVVAGFVNVFEVQDETLSVAILKRARYGLAPGSFLV